MKNKITLIRILAGDFSYDEKEIIRTFTQYFSTKFSSNHPIPMDQNLTLTARSITSEENEKLEATLDIKEIKETLFSMSPLKAPWPDGIPVMLYQKLWDIISNDLTLLVQQAFRSSHIPEEINKTHIVLIPKKKMQEKIQLTINQYLFAMSCINWLPKLLQDVSSLF